MYWGGYEIIIAKGFSFVNTKDSQICQKHLTVFVYFAQFALKTKAIYSFSLVAPISLEVYAPGQGACARGQSLPRGAGHTPSH